MDDMTEKRTIAKLGLAPHSSLCTFFRKAEKKIFCFVENDSGYFGNLKNNFFESFSAGCWDCNREIYSYMQLCKICMQQRTPLCFRHLKTSTQVCMVSSHTGTILSRFGRGKLEMLLSSLNAIARSSSTPYDSRTFRSGRMWYRTGTSSRSQAMSENSDHNNIWSLNKSRMTHCCQ